MIGFFFRVGRRLRFDDDDDDDEDDDEISPVNNATITSETLTSRNAYSDEANEEV